MSHLVALRDGWALWRWACLRAAGFPARRVTELASAELAATADRLLAAEDAAAHQRLAVIAACRAALDHAGPEPRRSIQRALKRLWQHRLPDPIVEPAAEGARRQLAARLADVETLRVTVAADYSAAQRATSQALRRVAQDDRFRQALLWQNRAAVHAGIDRLLQQPIEATDSDTRGKERLVASYLQRYCVKNDTIGFFGPCGWARFEDSPAAIAQRPGPALLASRTVYYEYWAIDALAARLSEDPALRPFLAPRRLPRFRVEGTTLHYPVGRTTALSPELAAIAAHCDGERTARDLARELVDDPALALRDEADVWAGLDELVEARVLHWTLEIPTAGPHPERALAALLARVGDPAARARAHLIVDELEHARAAVAASTSAAALEPALVAFDLAFTRATGADSQRAHGHTYAARTPIYEECRRDLALALGRPVLDRLAPPLALVMQSARWFSHEIAARYRGALGAIYARLRDDDPIVDFQHFWQHVPALFPGAGAPGSIVGAVRAELHRRWADVLAIDPSEPVVQRRAAALAAVHERFAAPGPGWPAARHHSPDLMIAAAGAGALARGDYLIVLGELHAGFNTIAGPFLKLHPDPDELIAARDADIDPVCIAPVWSRAVTGADYYSPSPRDLDLETGETRSARPRSQVIAIGELVIEERAGALEVRTRDGRARFDVIAFLEHHLIAESFAAFSLIAPAPRTPRVTIDDVVIARATWRVTPAELTWPALEPPAARFVAARRWARALGLPRHVFVKTPEEVKPAYVDFDSTVYVELLAKYLRGASAAALSEMLPAVADTWVVDGEGAHYTAELRIAAVDPIPWRPIPWRPAP